MSPHLSLSDGFEDVHPCWVSPQGWKDPFPQQHHTSPGNAPLGRLVKLGNAEFGAPGVSQHLACCSQRAPGAKLWQSSVLGDPGWSYSLGHLKHPWNLSAAGRRCLCVCCEGCSDWHMLLPVQEWPDLPFAPAVSGFA